MATTTANITADTTALDAAKTTASGLIAANAPESTTPGQHVVGSFATLSAALTATTATSADAQSIVDGQATTLNTAISTYNLAIVPASIKDVDATLSDLTVNGTTVTGFNPSVFTYDVELLAGTTDVPTVTATVHDTGKANEVVTAAGGLPGSTTILVTAEDTTVTATYTINFTVATLTPTPTPEPTPTPTPTPEVTPTPVSGGCGSLCQTGSTPTPTPITGGGGGGSYSTPTPTLTPTPVPTPSPAVLGAYIGPVIIPTLPANPTQTDYQNLLNALIQQLAYLRSLLAGQQGTVAGATGYQFTHTLRLGDFGEGVRQLQIFLKAQGTEIYPEGLITGYFGLATQRAVQRFQVKYGLAKAGDPGYGYVGPATRAKINALQGL